MVPKSTTVGLERLSIPFAYVWSAAIESRHADGIKSQISDSKCIATVALFFFVLS
jgi:hypothetical protein